MYVSTLHTDNDEKTFDLIVLCTLQNALALHPDNQMNPPTKHECVFIRNDCVRVCVLETFTFDEEMVNLKFQQNVTQTNMWISDVRAKGWCNTDQPTIISMMCVRPIDGYTIASAVSCTSRNTKEKQRHYSRPFISILILLLELSIDLLYLSSSPILHHQPPPNFSVSHRLLLPNVWVRAMVVRTYQC